MTLFQKLGRGVNVLFSTKFYPLPLPILPTFLWTIKFYMNSNLSKSFFLKRLSLNCWMCGARGTYFSLTRNTKELIFFLLRKKNWVFAQTLIFLFLYFSNPISETLEILFWLRLISFPKILEYKNIIFIKVLSPRNLLLSL